MSGLLGLAGCAHYVPAPIDRAQFPAALESRRLDLAPGAAVGDVDLLQAALTRSPALSEAQAAYRSARAAARTARVRPPISLGLVAEYSKQAGGSSPWLLSAITDIPLDYGVRRGARLGAADILALQALYDYGEAVWTVRTALRRAHIERVTADLEIALAQRLVAVRLDRSAKLEARVRSGEDARPIALLAQVDLAIARRRLDAAVARRAQADAALAKALGVSPAAVEALPLTPAPETPALPVPADLAAWRATASLSRADVLRAVADYDQAETALRLEVAKQYPDVRIGPGYIWERGVAKYPFNLSLALPPVDLNRAAIHEAEVKRAQAGLKLETVQANALAAVDQSAAALSAADAGLTRARREDLPLARRTAAAAVRSLQAGETDRTDQEAAEAAALDAELTALDGWRLALLAQIDLEDALRRPFDPAETAVLQAAVAHLRESP